MFVLPAGCADGPSTFPFYLLPALPVGRRGALEQAQRPCQAEAPAQPRSLLCFLLFFTVDPPAVVFVGWCIARPSPSVSFPAPARVRRKAYFTRARAEALREQRELALTVPSAAWLAFRL